MCAESIPQAERGKRDKTLARVKAAQSSRVGRPGSRGGGAKWQAMARSGTPTRLQHLTYVNCVRVALFKNREAAEVIRQRLERAGIPGEVHDGRGLAILWFVSRRAVGARLEVPVGREAEAHNLLLKWDSTDERLGTLLKCPECGSLRVNYPQVTHKSLLTNLALGLLAALGFVEKDYYCEDCHWMWTEQGTRSRPPRAHAAPDYFLD
jgi:hypothetical protein